MLMYTLSSPYSLLIIVALIYSLNLRRHEEAMDPFLLESTSYSRKNKTKGLGGIHVLKFIYLESNFKVSNMLKKLLYVNLK